MKLGYIGIDQNGDTYKLEGKHPRKELMTNLSASNARKMFIDTKNGESKHIGYIISGLWITLYEIHEWQGGAA